MNTGWWPTVDEPAETWHADPGRWDRWRPVRFLAAAELVAFGAGWVWAGDWIGGGVAATLVSLPVLALCAARYGPDLLARLEASEEEHTRCRRERADLHLRITDVSSRQRNHELDELAERRARKDQG